MTENSQAFINKLDELIRLFGKLREKAIREGMVLNNDPMYQNFEMLAKNYQLIKNNLPQDLIEEIGGPLKEIISDMVDQLKKELGENPSIQQNSTVYGELEEIDRLLKQDHLSEKEINDLLDKRTSFNKNP